VKRVLAVVLAIAALPAGCRIPEDPGETLERVSGGTLRVGAAEHEPWVKLGGSEPGGVEPGLVRRFAGTIEAEVEWTEGSEAELVEALHERQLDLVIAGIDSKSPWKKKGALTRPYYTSRVVIAVPPGHEVRYDLEGLTVQAEEGTGVPGLVERKTDANAEPVAALVPGRPAAAEDHLLDDLELEGTHVGVEKHKHVMATQLGENAFLVKLERFLLRNEELAKQLLDREGRP
jgi:polar amino acid transport system substrate-binding protein